MKPQKKRLKNKVVRTYTFHIDGMYCQNCVNAVTRAINDIGDSSVSRYIIVKGGKADDCK